MAHIVANDCIIVAGDERWHEMHRRPITACTLLLLCCAPQMSAAPRRDMNSIPEIEKLGAHLVYRGHVLDGRRLLEPACKRPDATSAMHCMLAKAYMDDPDLDPKILSRVEAELQTALRLDPESGTVYRFMAEYANLQGEYRKALIYAQKGLEVKHPDKDCLRQLTIAHSNLGDYKAALVDVEKRFKASGPTEASFISKGDLLYKLNRHDEAVVQYREALKLRNCDTTINLIVDCLTRDGKYQAAIDELSALIKKNPIDGEALAKRASLESKMKRYKESVQDYSAAIAQDKTARLYTARAQVYSLTGQKKLADEDLAQAKKLTESNF